MADTDIGWAHAEGLAGLCVEWPHQLFVGEITAPDPGSGLPDELGWPYGCLWVPPGDRPAITLAGYGGEATTTTQLTVAALDVRSVLAGLDRLAGMLHRRRPDIPGRRCGLVTQVPGTPGPPHPEVDPQVRHPDGRPIYFSFLQFTLFSAPTA